MVKYVPKGMIGETEAVTCEVCGKPFITKGFFWRKKTCSERCKLIRWALIEANKVKKEKK